MYDSCLHFENFSICRYYYSIFKGGITITLGVLTFRPCLFSFFSVVYSFLFLDFEGLIRGRYRFYFLTFLRDLFKLLLVYFYTSKQSLEKEFYYTNSNQISLFYFEGSFSPFSQFLFGSYCWAFSSLFYSYKSELFESSNS